MPAPAPAPEEQAAGVPGPLFRRARVSTAAWVLSAMAHVLLGGLAAYVITRGARVAPAVAEAKPAATEHVAEGESLTIELPTLSEPTNVVAQETVQPEDKRETPHASGPEQIARPDASRAGRGGTPEANDAALNLADRDEAIALAKDPQSRIDRSQVQRLNTSRERASLDDRRATLEPMIVTFLVSGKGSRNERRPIAEEDPSRGSRAAPSPGVLGAKAGALMLDDGGDAPRRIAGNAREGGAIASAGAGVLRGEVGDDHRASADVAFARPLVTEGRPAVPANTVAKARDNVESEQEVAASVQSLLHASTAGGIAGVGRGGERGGPITGAGGEDGPGSKATPMGQGGGALVDLDGSDPRLSDYQRRMGAKLRPLWENAFPKWAALEGRQGRAIVSLTILADGTVQAVGVTRASGVPEYDENVRRAVLRAAPFDPLPPNLRARSMHWSISFDSTNPVVR